MCLAWRQVDVRKCGGRAGVMRHVNLEQSSCQVVDESLEIRSPNTGENSEQLSAAINKAPSEFRSVNFAHKRKVFGFEINSFLKCGSDSFLSDQTHMTSCPISVHRSSTKISAEQKPVRYSLSAAAYICFRSLGVTSDRWASSGTKSLSRR